MSVAARHVHRPALRLTARGRRAWSALQEGTAVVVLFGSLVGAAAVMAPPPAPAPTATVTASA